MHQKPGTFVFVIWLDAFSEDAWVPEDEAKIRPCEIHSVGMIVEHTAEHMTLALNHDTFNQNFSCIMTIPIGMIQRVKRLT